MLNNKYITNFLFKNNNIQIYKVFRNIYHQNCNVINSNIFKFNEYLSVNLVLEIPKSTDIGLLKKYSFQNNQIINNSVDFTNYNKNIDNNNLIINIECAIVLVLFIRQFNKLIY